MRLGSAFQKVNFLRDLKADYEDLSRTYFPNTDLNQLDETSKLKIIEEIEADFKAGYQGIVDLPMEAKFGVYTAYIYYNHENYLRFHRQNEQNHRHYRCLDECLVRAFLLL